jgi:hypothetical protein
MKKFIGIAAIIFASSPLLTHADNGDDLLARNPSARNDRHSSELRDTLAQQPTSRHRILHHTSIRHHRKALR